MDADSFDAQGDSCETMSAAVYGLSAAHSPAAGSRSRRGKAGTVLDTVGLATFGCTGVTSLGTAGCPPGLSRATTGPEG